MDHDQVRRVLDDLERRVRRLEEVEAGREGRRFSVPCSVCGEEFTVLLRQRVVGGLMCVKDECPGRVVR